MKTIILKTKLKEWKSTKKGIVCVEFYLNSEKEKFNEYCQLALNYAIKNSNKKAKNTGYRRIFDYNYGEI